MQKPYTPVTLAERWGCSAEKIRRMCRAGELAKLPLGPKLIRIPASEVERFECQATESERTEESLSSSTPMTEDRLFDARLALMTGGSQRLALVHSGNQSMPLLASE